MKRLLCLLLLVTSIRTFAEVRPITLDENLILTGESGFFFTREDTEDAAFCMEERELLERDLGIVSTENLQLKRKNENLKTILLITSIVGPLLGFTVKSLLK